MKLVHYVLGIMAVVYSFGQNLVPNPGFESYSACPTTYSQADLATVWYKSMVNNIAPHQIDYVNACNSGSSGSPWNTWGTQMPYEGNAYMILATASPNIAVNYRENIYAQLTTPLVPGMMYQMIMHVNITDNSKYATNRLGMKFSTTSHFPIDNVIHLSSSGVINNRSGWVTTSGVFTADSAYQYVGIGNFYTDAMTSIVLDCPSCAYNLMGYAIDYICVSRINRYTGNITCNQLLSRVESILPM